MCRAPVAIALMWPGVPLCDWPSMRPARSKTPQARSSDSRTIVLKAVRTSVACCSSRIEARRPAAIPTVTGSSVMRSPMIRLPSSATRAVAPGPTTVVDSRSSTMAGPSISVPGPMR